MAESSGKVIIGVDLGGTNIQVGVVDGAGKVLARSKAKTRARGTPESVLDRIVGCCDTAMAHAGLTRDALLCVGIGAPGAVHAEKGLVIEAANIGWRNYDLARELASRVGVPVAVDNDVNAAVVGEHRHGASCGKRDVLGVWVGTGVGAGLILGGRLHEGARHTAGEIGHVILFPGAPTAWTKLEWNCSRTAIANQIAHLIRCGHRSAVFDMVEGDLSRIRSKVIGEAYQADDGVTRGVVDRSAELLGIAIANVVTLLSVEQVVLGGGLSESLGEPYRKRVAKVVASTVFPSALADVEVVLTQLNADAGVIGAAVLARERVGT